ncbi:Rieske (2Fe-2S) protein [Corynebacterium flavescens]|uniref:Iron-sulfur protein n=2 Tax=Corynebacterium flavescens TaxID=28028 RepID=A0A1L7CQ03_CORFL|nr:Rieske (2Fe-2S) protein [Corynebacterium flavescens]APT87932.1 iron-sulfur protein [Corynebacterium flavescens]KAA8719558.1 Rieske (2Fe-2S) protein [Corynebacterium flavescens]MDN6099967.1 Rieske (2Fe-2S) protein [Corynebacterium flavescens]MDN6199560.1 Rieske (2Fe-2S) protein [Corynebacterium flavescens]MDN6225892.1 Rieske (2Fe-2S) protein [Corynebacterium flavescens]
MTRCSRRMFLLGTATTFAGAYLAACGKSPSAEIAATGIPVGSAIIVDKVIFAQPTAGIFKAYSQTCPHQGNLITKVEGSTATCTSHYTSYNLIDGSVISGPGTKPLEEYGIDNDGTTVKTTGA